MTNNSSSLSSWNGSMNQSIDIDKESENNACFEERN